MVYADVPEHEGFNEDNPADREQLPATPTPTDEWLARISGQLQVFVDAINAAREDDEDGTDDHDKQPDSGSSADTPAAGGDPAGGQGQTEKTGGDDKPAPAKKTTAAPAKRTEVKGD